MDTKQVLCAGLGLGAGLMYLFDPKRGRRRRAELSDSVTHLAHVADKALGKTSRDLSNRVTGVVAEVNSLLKTREVGDEVLLARVRTQLGHLVSHPHAIEAAVNAGRVTLRGPVLAGEVADLLEGIALPGVVAVVNQLEVHEQAGDHPSLQGGRPRHPARSEWEQANWSPSARLLAGLAGGGLALYGAQRRDVVGTALELAGLGLCARSLTNLEMRDVVGLSGGQGITVQKTVNIKAPVERVFEVWRRHEDFPHFMSRVREVKKLAEGRYHWTVDGPAGIPVEWEGVITKQIPNQLLAFESVPGSLVEQRGVVRFQPNADGGTSVHIKLSYHPPAGVAGHAVAKLFGADPRSELIADLLRMKSYIETGQQPHDAAERRTRAAHA